MQIERDDLAEDRQAIGLALAEARDSGLSVDAFEIIEAVQRSTTVKQALVELTQKQADLRALRFTYTDEYPEVQQLQREAGSPPVPEKRSGFAHLLEHTACPTLKRGRSATRGSRFAVAPEPRAATAALPGIRRYT